MPCCFVDGHCNFREICYCSVLVTRAWKVCEECGQGEVCDSVTSICAKTFITYIIVVLAASVLVADVFVISIFH